jgi:hypothetical protein
MTAAGSAYIRRMTVPLEFSPACARERCCSAKQRLRRLSSLLLEVPMRKLAAIGVVITLVAHSTALLAQSAVDQFHKVKLMVNTGDKPAETDAIIRLEKDQLVIRSKAGGADLKKFAYNSIKSAEYSYSKSPRWKSGIGAAVAVGVFALPLFFMKGKKHWLTVQTEGDYALLRLDKGNYKIILPAFEARSGVKVETVAEEK